MAMTSCSECGTRREVGYPCPTCMQVKEARRLHDEQQRLERERAKEQRRLEEDRRRIEDERIEDERRLAREQFEQQHQLEEEMVAEADRRHREAFQEHEERLRELDAERAEEEEQRLEEYRRITANADRLRAEAKIARASEVLAAGLPAEAAMHCKSAIEKLDASYIPAYLVLADALARNDDLPQSEVYFRKGLLLLKNQDFDSESIDMAACRHAARLLKSFHYSEQLARFWKESLQGTVSCVCGRLARIALGDAEQSEWMKIFWIVEKQWVEPSVLDDCRQSLRSAVAVGLTAGDRAVCQLVEALERRGLGAEALDVCTTRVSRGSLRINQEELALWLAAMRLEAALNRAVSQDTRPLWLKRVPSSQREKVKSLFEGHVVRLSSASPTDVRTNHDAEHVRQVALRALRNRYQEWLPEIEASHRSDAERKGAAACDQILAQEPSWKIEERAKRAAKWTFWPLIILGVPVFFIAWPVAVVAWLILRYVMPGYWQQSVQARAAEARDSTTREEYSELQQNEEKRWSQLLAETVGGGREAPRTLPSETAVPSDRIPKGAGTTEMQPSADIAAKGHGAPGRGPAAAKAGTATTALHDAVSHPGSTTVFCDQCGVEIGGDPGTRFCWSCGADQSEAIVERL